MRCEEVRRWISPYLDSEPDPHTNFEIAQHLESCAECRQVFEAERQLEAAVSSSLETDPQTQAAWDRAAHRVLAGGLLRPRRWQVAVATAAGLLLLVGGWRAGVVARQDLVRSAVHNHQTYLANRMSLDVQTSSPQIIETFFEQKLPFPVQCPRTLASQSVQLVGARLCHLKQVPVAYLLYHVDHEPVSVFLLDEASLAKFSQPLENSVGSMSAFQLDGATVVAARSSRGVVCAVGRIPRDRIAPLVAAYLAERDATKG